MAAPPPKQLIDLYKIAVEEYRFEVKLGWDRTMYYMVFNTAIIGVGAGLLRLEQHPVACRFIAAIFVLGFCTSIIGAKAMRKGHEYYRRSVVKKTLLEDMLGLTIPVPDYPHRHTLAIGTTASQSDHISILHNPEQWVGRKLRRSSISFLLTLFLWMLATVNLAGVSTALWLSFRPVAQVNPPPLSIVPIGFTTISLQGWNGVAPRTVASSPDVGSAKEGLRLRLR